MFGQPGKVYFSFFLVIFVFVTLESVAPRDDPHFGFMKALKNFKRSGIVTCTYKGKTYAQGSEWVDGCEECHCQAGDIVRCVDVKCSVPMCVDFFTPEGKCCDVCPGSPNCWRDDNEIMPAGAPVVIRMGPCEKTCWCPGPSTYAEDGKNTRADCDEFECQQH